MHVLFHDVNDRMKDDNHRFTFKNIPFRQLLYADDTLLISRSPYLANKILHLVEEESNYYHLKLNKGKCSYKHYNCKGVIKFRDGTKMKSEQAPIYLGAVIDNSVTPRTEIHRRITATMAVLKKMELFWNRTKCNRKWKLQVFNAVIMTKLLYGLETLEAPQGLHQSLNTFQLKGLRKIMKLNTTFVDRNNDNQTVYDKASLAYHGTNNIINKPPIGIVPATVTLEEKKMRLLGHVLRRDRFHPMHQSIFSTQSAHLHNINSRRVGRPRENWAINNMQQAWYLLQRVEHRNTDHCTIPLDINNREQREKIISSAESRSYPFFSKQKESLTTRLNVLGSCAFSFSQ